MNLELLQDHLARPRHAGRLADADVFAEEVNPICGDQLRLEVNVAGGRITGVGWLAYGCPPTLACGSALAEMLHDSRLDDAGKITRRQIAARLGGLPPRKQHAAALAWEAWQSVLAKLNSKG